MADQDTTAPAAADTDQSPSRRARFIQGLRQNQGNFRSWMQQRTAIPGAPPTDAATPIAARAQAAKATLAARSGGAPQAADASPATPAAPVAPAAAAAPPAPVAPATPAAAPAAPIYGTGANPGVGANAVAWLNSLTPDQQAQLAGGAGALANLKAMGNSGTPFNDAQLAQYLGGNYQLQQQQSYQAAHPELNAFRTNDAGFTANNPGYAATGYQGNAAQVASQVANGAQSAGIPTGVLGSSFYQGGSNYGGQQTAGNTASGNNGNTNWTGSTFGVDPTLSSGLVSGVANLQNALVAPQSQATTGMIGGAVTDLPALIAAQRSQYSAAPTQVAAAPVAAASAPQVGPASVPASQSATAPASASASLANAIQSAQKPAQTATVAPATATNQTGTTNQAAQSNNAQVSAALNAQQNQPATPATQNAQRTTQGPQSTRDQQAANGATTKGVSQAAGGSSIITRGV